MTAGSIADELILLAMYPANDGWRVGADGVPRRPAYLRAGVSVALLADLAVAGAIEVGGAGERVSSTGRGVGGHTELNELVARIASQPGQTPAYWAAQIYFGEPERRRLISLCRQNLLLEYERKVRRLWWSTTVRRVFVREDDSVTALAVQRLSDALRTGEADEPTTALLAIVHACGLHLEYFKDLGRRERDLRIRNVLGGHWVWRATKRCLATMTPVM